MSPTKMLDRGLVPTAAEARLETDFRSNAVRTVRVLRAELAGLLTRTMRAVRLETTLYAEVVGDRSATMQALALALVAVAANGLAPAMRAVLAGAGDGGRPKFLHGAFNGAISWLIVVLALHVVGRYLLRGSAALGGSVRALGFASSPSILLALSWVPIVGRLIQIAASVWWLLAVLTAVHVVQDCGRARTVVTVAAALVLYAFLRPVVRATTGL